MVPGGREGKERQPGGSGSSTPNPNPNPNPDPNPNPNPNPSPNPNPNPNQASTSPHQRSTSLHHVVGFTEPERVEAAVRRQARYAEQIQSKLELRQVGIVSEPLSLSRISPSPSLTQC